MSFLNIILVLAIAVTLVSVLRRLHLPPILGYLLTGTLVGPDMLGLMEFGKNLAFVAEFGVVFLLFTIGLELSLPKLISMRRALLGLGGLQVLLCSSAIFGAGMGFGLAIPHAFTIAGAMALSSTAVAVKQLMEQGELHTPFGRTVLSILLFQDLAAVPFLIIVPTFAGESGALGATLIDASVKGLGVFIIMLLAGRFLLRPLFHAVAAARSSELFMLAALLVILASAYITEHLGLSMALGAFLAGVMLAETEYHHQIESDILPFRDILLGLFFITVGMMLSPIVLFDNIGLILLIVVALTIVKTIIISVLGLVAGLKPVDAIRSGLTLAQGGEFGFALLALAFDNALLDERSNQIIIAAIIFSIALAPLLIRKSKPIADFILSAFNDTAEPLTPALFVPATESHSSIEDHVIICGFGRVGQTLARFLERDGIPYIGLDLDPKRLREASAANEPILYGDCTELATLEAVGLNSAKLLLISFDNPIKAKTTIERVRSLGIKIPILVRSKDDSHLEMLQAAGANEVVPEILEASLMLVHHMLVLLGQPKESVQNKVMEEKSNRYSMLRAFYKGDDDSLSIEDSTSMLHAVTITEGAFAIGKTIAELTARYPFNLDAFKRDGIKSQMPSADTVVKAGDILIICGEQNELHLAEEKILQG